MHRRTDEPIPEGRHGGPWAPSPLRGGLACIVIWASGTDTRLDGVVRIAAVRRGLDGTWESLEETCSPFSSDRAGATQRLRQTFGVTSTDLDGQPSAAEVWPRIRDFIGERPVVAHDGALVDTWSRALDAEAGLSEAPLDPIGLDEIAMLLEPGALASMGPAQLVTALVDPVIAPSPPGALQPPHILAALAELVARFGDLGPAAHALCAFGWLHALELFRGTDPGAARRLALSLSIVDQPESWGGDVDLFAAGRLKDGLVSLSESELVEEDDPLGLVDPAAADSMIEFSDETPLKPDVDEPAPFLDEDMALLDDIFKVHLPALFGPGTSEATQKSLYRKSQHRVAEEIARCLGSDELLLVHAPTGTGKTLAYLLPALMWSRRYGVRVGIATYTRALQSQAMEREVPRALEALNRAGLSPGYRVSILKGREHSLCWRALRIQAPAEGDDPETWLGWVALALFGLRDRDGDLDRFPRRPPVRLTSSTDYRRSLGSLVAQVRGRSGCCSTQGDRAVCCAEIARRRAERSHVVLTNQSFALARPEFFRRVVFDECEHLHDQAMSAWSHRITFTEMRRVLRRLHNPDVDRDGRMRRSKPPLDRLSKILMPGTGGADRLKASRQLWTNASSAISHMESTLLEYERWRANAQAGRSDSMEHSLFREFVDSSGQAENLVTARLNVVMFLGRLDGSLAQLSEELETMGLKRVARIRRALELARVEISDVGKAVDAWLPIDEGAPRLGGTVFHDVERNVREDLVLAALVLLPGNALGKYYYPELGSAAFVSATTRIGGSFDQSKGYLGLDRVAEKNAETGEFDRTAGTRRVTTFHAPEVFDYERVLVGLPRGVPPVQNREAYIDFLSRYLPWYAERTRGRMLVLFTSLRDIREVAERAGPVFASRGLPLFWQGMDSVGKEELSDLFRERVESTLFGVDTFWYGADFPGETLETLVIARLPYGVPDRYHHAQCAAIGSGAQRNRIYMPRALAKFRQGFGRLMRKASDKGVVMVLDGRITERRHGHFLKELPVERPGSWDPAARARMARGDLDLVSREAFAHLGLLADMERRGLSPYFSGGPDAPGAPAEPIRRAARDLPLGAIFDSDDGPLKINESDLPF
ncbi:MAG: Rad3-related DNA helicase [Planctomycetota bacterium]|jgi:Rad3-related DNA helicase